jgi:hypothetical protein
VVVRGIVLADSNYVLADSNYVRSSTCGRNSVQIGKYESYVFLDVTPCGFVGK